MQHIVLIYLYFFTNWIGSVCNSVLKLQKDVCNFKKKIKKI